MRRPEFAERFRQITEGETNVQVALRLKVTPAFIGGVRRDIYGMSRDLLDRFVEEYRMDRREWQQLAGHLDAEQAREAQALEQMKAIALEAAHRAIAAVNGAQRFAAGLFELSRKYNQPVPVYLSGGAEHLTVENAEKLLAEIDRQMAEEAREAEAESAEQAPIRLKAPRKGR